MALEPFGDLKEFNISSPNTVLVNECSKKPEEMRRLVRAVRAPRGPLIVKLLPDFAEVNERAIYGNTRRVTEPRLSQGTGGLSRPELYPATLENVPRTPRRVRQGARDQLS